MTNNLDFIEPALTPEEKIACDRLKEDILLQLESSELNERVKKTVTLVLEWNIFKPALYEELLMLVKSTKDRPEFRTLVNELAPLIFMMIAKTHFIQDDLAAHRNGPMHEKRYTI